MLLVVDFLKRQCVVALCQRRSAQAIGARRTPLSQIVHAFRQRSEARWLCDILDGSGTLTLTLRGSESMEGRVDGMSQDAHTELPIVTQCAQQDRNRITLSSTDLGMPVSTTHCISACIMGVGASKRISAVRWGVAGNIVTAWILTLP